MELTDVNGFVWPAGDVGCRAVVFDGVSDMAPGLALVPHKGLALQAGGNCGVWAAYLANRFETVVTAEPDATNFHCLTENVPDNVQAHEVALGKPNAASIRMITKPHNVGAHYVNGAGPIPVVTIDSLKLPGCDFLCLDIEGCELDALIGAAVTIEAFGPVIQIEDKGLSERYGHKQGDAEKWLRRFGYRVAHRVKRDVVLVKKQARKAK